MAQQSVLLVVDMQIDFCPGGSLAVPGGDTIIPLINRYIELFHQQGTPVFATRDWHPPVTTHFRQYGGLWPPHCMQWSDGARLHPDLRLPVNVIIVSKGMDPEKDNYSALQAKLESGLSLAEQFSISEVKQIYICGLATDYCVKETALDALKEGYAVTVLKDAAKGVELQPGDSVRALEEISEAGGELADLALIEEKFK
jgi:nicotinamidase/pyrazinamidase